MVTAGSRHTYVLKPFYRSSLFSQHGLIHYLCGMKIGFDAKRAYHNGTGLGHYSRTLIHSLAALYPQHDYCLFNPRPSTLYRPAGANIHEVQPAGFLSKIFRSAWRSSWVKADLKRLGIDLYHGLSHEIPLGMQHTGIPSVVTMHDLIFERYPRQYNRVDVQIYRKKFSYAARHADKIIAISRQTRDDLISLYHVPEQKIEVCYQSCSPAFARWIDTDEKNRIKTYYGLPDNYFLYVGSVIERKNLLLVCQALNIIKSETNLPLVVIGSGGAYKQKVQEYIRQNGLERRVLFMADTERARNTETFRTAADFPAIYQMAAAMIYPSVYEGFGIPVLEALWSRLPVITSNTSCLPEAGGDAALYINPHSAEELAAAMQRVAADEALRMEMMDKGWQHAHNFTNEKCAAAVMKVYEGLVTGAT